MKNRLSYKFVSLWVLLLHSIFVGIESRHVNLTISEEELRREMLSKSDHPKTKFSDSNEDLLYQISEDLHVSDLVEIMRSNSKLSCVADDQFWRKYKHFNLAIMNSGTVHSKEIKIIEYEECVEIYDLHLAADVLNFFGHVIQKLKIQNHDIFLKHPAILKKYFRDSGPKTLTTLNLDQIKENTLQRFVVPFEKVRELEFIVNTAVKHRGPLNLIFPVIERIKIHMHSDADYSFIACSFPHLEHVHISAMKKFKTLQLQIEAFLSKNSHLKGVHFVVFETDFVKTIAKYLPHLKNLTLEAAAIKGDSVVTLQHVEHFKLYEQFPTSIKKLHFPSLHTLEMQFSDDMLGDWIAFLLKHNNISRLSVTQVDGEMQLLKLTAPLKNLTDISLECSTYIEAREIFEFINEHENKLVKFRLKVFNGFNDSDISFLKEKVGNDWHVAVDADNDDSNAVLSLEKNVRNATEQG